MGVCMCLQFACQLCYQLFKQKQTYVNHLRTKHGIGDVLRCPKCGKTDFTSYGVFKKHRKACVAV